MHVNVCNIVGVNKNENTTCCVGNLISYSYIDFWLVHIYVVSGDANFAMLSTQLTVGGFTQPGVARGLIETPSNAEKGFSHRFLWFFPHPLFKKFASLGEVDQEFVQKMSKYGIRWYLLLAMVHI